MIARSHSISSHSLICEHVNSHSAWICPPWHSPHIITSSHIFSYIDFRLRFDMRVEQVPWQLNYYLETILNNWNVFGWLIWAHLRAVHVPCAQITTLWDLSEPSLPIRRHGFYYWKLHFYLHAFFTLERCLNASSPFIHVRGEIGEDVRGDWGNLKRGNN